MGNIGKMLVFAGLIIVIAGLAVLAAARLKLPFPGKMPGDIIIRKGNFTFYVPLVSSLIISVIASVLLYFLRR